MDPKEKSPSDESVLEAPYVGDTRSYSDFILYLVNSGRFQHNNLLDHGRRKGVLTLFQAERVVKLTRERRLSPVKVAFTPGGRKQLVYLIAIVRTGCTLEDLNDLVDRLNMYIDEMSPDDKESAVRDLIYSTTSRVMPGIRYLPIHWYEAGEVVPPREIIDEDNRRVDGDGMPIVDTDEELVVVQQGKGNDRRNSKDVAMPSTSAVLSDASTDSDRAIPTHKKNKRKAPLPPVNWRTAEGSSSGSDKTDMAAKRVKKEPKTEQPMEVEDVPEEPPAPTSDAFADHEEAIVDQPDESETVITPSIASTSTAGDEGNISRQEFQRELSKLFSGFGDLKQLVQQIAETKATKEKPPKVATRGETPPYHNDVESKIVSYFPINQYTKAIDWMIKQPIIQTLLHYEVMRKAYRLHPVFKPESDKVLGKYIDYLLSTRLQTHMGKATTRVCKMDYGRFAMPMVILKIAEKEIAPLAKMRVPGTKSVADFLKDRCNGYRRTKVLGSDFILGSDSVEEMAHRILAERVDFIQNHTWIFNHIKEVRWTFDDELKKTSKLSAAEKMRRDPSFDGYAEPYPEDIELLIFDDMDKGQVLDDMDEAKALVEELETTGITKPMFPRSVWDTIKAVVQPSVPEINAAKRNYEQKEKIKEARLERRRATYAAKRGSDRPEEELESDEDSLEELEDEQTPTKDSFDEVTSEQPLPSDPDQVGAPTRSEGLRNIFGDISDITSSTSSDKDAGPSAPNVSVNVSKEGQMVFTAEEDSSKDEVEPSGAEKTVATPEGPMATGSLLKKAQNVGLIGNEDQVVVAADVTANVSTKYSVVVNTPDASEPTVVTGGSNTTQTFSETLSKPPAEKTALQKYADMDEDILSETVMEGKMHSSSSSSSGNASDKDAGAKTPTGEGLSKKSKDAEFKTPQPRNMRSSSKGKRPDTKEDSRDRKESKDRKGKPKSSKKHSKK